MSLADLDANFLKSIASLHSNEFLLTGEPSPLQLALEEAIKTKTGVTKDFTALINTTVRQQRIEELKASVLAEESRTASSSDNELELDLLKEDLMCVVCNEMDVGARNRLLECSDCHSLYHQECHTPVVSALEADDVWICQGCKDERKRLEQIRSPTPPLVQQQIVPAASKPVVTIIGKLPEAVTYRSSSSSSSSSSSNGKSSTSSSKSSSKLSSSGKPAVSPKINIVNVDKRFQIMKKKAAKLQESKRKMAH